MSDGRRPQDARCVVQRETWRALQALADTVLMYMDEKYEGEERRMRALEALAMSIGRVKASRYFDAQLSKGRPDMAIDGSTDCD